MDQQLEQLLQGCKNSKQHDQEQLYHYCFPLMYKVCLRYNANDQDAANCYNEAMCTVLTKINQYKNEGEFMGWVRRIMVNTCLNKIKKEKKFVYKEMSDSANEFFYVEPSVYEKINAEQILELVRTLPKQTAMVFNLYIMEGYSHEQIGQMLDISNNTSKWHLNNARTILKEKITNINVNENYKNA